MFVIYNQSKSNVFNLVLASMLIAVCTLATFIKVPMGNDAMVHLGSAAIFTIGIVFGKKYGAIAGSFGSAIFDLLMGFSPYTIWSFFIKGIAGFIVGFIANDLKFSNEYVRNLIAIIAAATWTLFGYIVAWSFVLDSFELALANIPFSLSTSILGLIVALPLAPLLKKQLIKLGKF